MDRLSPEPWLRGTLSGLDPVIAQILYSLQHAVEDLEYFTQGLSAEQLWKQPPGMMSVGAHIRHISGSIDRLLTYARGEQLSDEQMAALRQEEQPNGNRESVLAAFHMAIESAAGEIRGFRANTFEQPREVGRKRLPTSVGGLLVHVAEHTQRHVGQAINTAKLVKLS